MIQYLKLFRTLNLLVLISAIALIIISGPKITTLPTPSEIRPELFEAPIQKADPLEPYNFEYMGSDYTIYQMAKYELWGLVVSQNNIHSISDAYHDARSVDIKDLCVVWGSNLNGIYQEMEFWSETWTCLAKPKSGEARANFRWDDLSNNHLLSANAKVRDAISRVHLGDQIHIIGHLINYHPRGVAGFERRSSLVREDTGNGACEVIMVEKFEVLNFNSLGWHVAYSFAWNVLYISSILALLFFLSLPYLEYRYG